MTTKGFIFDYGGTLDTAGRHWGKVLWQAYARQNLPVTEEQFREAYVHAERTLGSHPIIKSDFTFYQTLDTKLAIELEYLKSKRYLECDEGTISRLRKLMLDELYEDVKKQTVNSAEVLSHIRKKYQAVLVSNFYGNINTVLKEFGLTTFFNSIIESAVVGIRKPDPRIFILGAERLGINPAEAIVVGDSYDKDIIPAKKAGCKAIWLKGEGWTEKEYDESLPDAIITNLSQLLSLDFGTT